MLDPMSLFAGMFMMVAVMWLYSVLSRSHARRNRQAQLRRAKQLIRSHGMTLGLYLPGFGVEDEALRAAVECLAEGSPVVLDRHGRLVGAIGEQSRRLRLVVDNTVI